MLPTVDAWLTQARADHPTPADERYGGVVTVSGHCDERGSREYNMALGENRALAVRAHLIRLGTDAARIQTRSYGEERPLDPGHSEAAWRRNRRGEFLLFR